MKLDTLPRPYQEALGFFEAYRRCGFQPEDIFFALAGPPGNHQVCVELHAQGKEVVAVAGFIKDSAENIFAEWKRIAEALRTGEIPEADIERNWQGSMARAQAVRLLGVLAEKGIIPPLSDGISKKKMLS